MSTRTVRLVLTLAALGAGACAPRPRLDPRPGIALTAELAKADALVAEGCYACLSDALATYERVAAGGDAPAAGLRAVDTALLLALRERELGLGRARSLEHAVELAAHQPPPHDISLFQSVVEVQAWHAYGVSKEQIDQSMGPLMTMHSTWPGWRARLAPGAARDFVGAYHLLSLDCTARGLLRDAGVEPWVPPSGAPPLLRFRAAVCPSTVDGPALDKLLDDDPRWAEAHFFLGEMALGKGTVRTAEKHLVEALKAIPELTAARVMLGHVYLASEEFQLARDAYRQANAAVPGQREAMLGEVKSLSALGRHEEAILILDAMERLGTWYMGEMYYWRAWNRYHLTQYDAANDDVLASRSRMPMDGQVDKLAGFIAIARNEVPRAETEFRSAVIHIEGGSDCDATYFLGSTQVMQRKWADAVPNFEKAEACYARAQQSLRARIKDIRGSDLPDDRQDVLVAAREKDIAAARLQEARSCYNAAVAYANLGDAAKARPFAERALTHPQMKPLAEQLLARLGAS
jgi:tetratricopeptide (TPR) repeat protein